MSYKCIVTSVANGVRTIQLNRPKVLNAMDDSILREITNILNDDINNENVVLTIVTGFGRFYSSGRDFSKTDENEFTGKTENDPVKFLKTLIDYPKLLIAVVNGPALGLAVTSLGLFDIVYASDRATFETPFLRFGLTPEACSSFTFPMILGRSRASEMLLMGEKLTAQDALQLGLVSKVIPHEELNGFIEGLHKYGQLPVNTVKSAKELMIESIRKELHDSLERESLQLRASFSSAEYLQRKSTILPKRSKL